MNRNDRIGHRLKLRDLHYLMMVAQVGSMARAAPRLGVSQPVLSKTIADLELLLGVRLLDRSPHGVEVTTYGRQLLRTSHAIFDELRMGVQEIEHLADPAVGQLSVGSNEASTLGIVPATIERIRQEHPQIVVNVVLLNTPTEQYAALRERSIDFAISRISNGSYVDEFETEVLFNQQQVVVAGGQNPWTQRATVDLAELLDEPWVLPPLETTSGQLAADVFITSGLSTPRAVVVTSSFQLNRGLLERGPFLALMPGSILQSFIKYSSLRQVPVILPRQLAPVGIVRLKKRSQSPLAKKFIAIARSIALSMPLIQEAPEAKAIKPLRAAGRRTGLLGSHPAPRR